MMFEARYLNDELNHFVKEVASQEPPLLTQLRVETQTTTLLPQMLCGPVEGALLKLLVSISGAKRCLEIGTFTGYSALSIASGLSQDGQLFTCELNESFAKTAQKYFNRSPYGHKIIIKPGRALDTLQHLQGPFDFAFIDADKVQYPQYFALIRDKLTTGGLLVVDNALWGGKVVSPCDRESKAIYRMTQAIKADPQFEQVLLTVRDGILVAKKH